MRFWSKLKGHVKAALQNDPSASSSWMVWWTFPHIKALAYHELAHALYVRQHPLLARYLAKRARRITGIEIHPGAQIGERCFIDHGMGVVIGETAIVGNDVLLYHGVTLGGVSLEAKKRHPTIEDGVLIGAGAKILGDITIGKGSKIAPNVVLKTSVSPGSRVLEQAPQILPPKSPDSHINALL